MNVQLKLFLKLILFVPFSVLLVTASKDVIELNSNEVFIIPIKRTDFDKQITRDEKLSITAVVNGLPDLPDNVYLKQRDATKDALLYGTVDDDGDYEFELIAKQLNTYEIYKNIIKLKFTPKDREPKNHIELKINNLNIEDIRPAKNEIMGIFRDILWTNTTDLFMTMIASPLDVGARAPLNPKSKEGVVVRISSKSDFSIDLILLDRETLPIKNRIPCPSSYKSSMEHAFKKRNFQVDWCRFRLIKKQNSLSV